MATHGKRIFPAAAVLAGSLLAAGVVLANGGPFVVKYPNGDPAAKGTLARLDPDLKPATEDRLKVLKEDLKIAFVKDTRGWDGPTSTPRAEVSAAYTIENPTDKEVTVDFGFPILRGVYLRMGMGPIPDVRVTLDKDYLDCRIISNSTIYGIIRARARETITKALAGDAGLAGLVARVKTASADERQAARQALAGHLTGKLKWNERDAALLVEYAGLEFGESKARPRDRGYLDDWHEDSLKLTDGNLGALAAIGEQKATQFFAQLAARFDAKAASTYEAIFSAWGGDVRERSVDLASGEVRPREIAVDPKALGKEELRLNAGSDPTVYARVDYFDEKAKISDAEKAACKSILKNLPVVFTFAPMNLLHYQAKFPARSTRVLTVSYSQYAYADTKAPASYQLAYVVHPASLWKDFGPINLQVVVPEGVTLRATADCRKTGREEREVYEERAAKKKPFDVYTANLKDKTGELFVAVDSQEWQKASGIKPTAAAAASPKQQTK